MANVIFNASEDDFILNSVLRSVAAPPGQGVPGARLSDEEAELLDIPATRWTLPGFTRKTRIRTSFGDLPIEALRLRDEVRTDTGRMLRVKWIDKVELDEGFLRRNPVAQPILIRENALDHGKPLRDMLISPWQELSYGLSNFQSRFAEAGEIKGRPNLFRKPSLAITYFLFHCGEPAVLFAEGVPVRVAPMPPRMVEYGDER